MATEPITTGARPRSDRMKKEHPAIGKIYVCVPLTLATPVIIGCGESENSDVDVLREPVFADSNKNADSLTASYPLIPATSLIGVFRSYLQDKVVEQLSPAERDQFKYLFGVIVTPEQKEKNPQALEAQSAMQCEDILLREARITVRDGVAIDLKTNTAKDKQKFTYEVIEQASSFPLRLEITLRKKYHKETFKSFLATIFAGIEGGHIRLGAKTNKGFGRLHLKKDAVKIAELEFSNSDHVRQWLSREPDYKSLALNDWKPFNAVHKQFQIAAEFSIKNSLLIKSYDASPTSPDAVPIKRKSGEQYVLPGTSVMGAVRHRAWKILRTLGWSEAEVDVKMKALFGFVKEDEKDNPAGRGRVRIEETIIDERQNKSPQNVFPEVQTRIKIDRFTGGTIHGALFEMMPLWQKGKQPTVRIIMTIKDYHDWEAGLLLLVLKDLWTGDLAIGGEKSVGRGVLQGHYAKIEQEGAPAIELKADAEGRPICKEDEFATLETFAQKLEKELNHAEP